MNPDETYKNNIGERLTKTLAEALSQGVVSEEEASSIANYILENIDKAQNSTQILDFLTELTQKWPIFDPTLTMELGEAMDKKEEGAVEKAENLIKENKIDEALKVAESATDETQQKLGGES